METATTRTHVIVLVLIVVGLALLAILIAHSIIPARTAVLHSFSDSAAVTEPG